MVTYLTGVRSTFCPFGTCLPIDEGIFFFYKIKTGITMKDSKCLVHPPGFLRAGLQAVTSPIALGMLGASSS